MLVPFPLLLRLLRLLLVGVGRTRIGRGWIHPASSRSGRPVPTDPPRSLD
jgi:hypothetical protein